MNAPDLIQGLLDAIASGDDEQCEAAAQACARQPMPAHAVPGLRPLLSDPDSDRRWWAVRTLALIGGDAVTPLLIERLDDADHATRCAAALGLGQMRAEPAIPALVARLADSDGWVRDSAADGLALIGEPAAPALVAAMRDERDGVRVRAASALRRIVQLNPERPGPNMDVHSPRGQAIGALFRGLQDPNYLVHQHCYDALDRLGLLDNLIVM